MYLVTDGEEAGLYGSLDGAGDAVRWFFEISDTEKPLLAISETHDLRMMDGDAADTLEYDLNDVPEDEYEELLEQAKQRSALEDVIAEVELLRHRRPVERTNSIASILQH